MLRQIKTIYEKLIVSRKPFQCEAKNYPHILAGNLVSWFKSWGLGELIPSQTSGNPFFRVRRWLEAMKREPISVLNYV